MKKSSLIFILLLSTTSTLPYIAHGKDVFSELSGEAARERTREARRKRDQIRSQVAQARAKLANESQNIQAQKNQISTANAQFEKQRQKLKSGIGGNLESLTYLIEQNNNVRAQLVNRLQLFRELTNEWLQFYQASTRAIDLNRSIAHFRTYLSHSRRNTALPKSALEPLARHVDPVLRQMIQDLPPSTLSPFQIQRYQLEVPANPLVENQRVYKDIIGFDDLEEVARHVFQVEEHMESQIKEIDNFIDQIQAIKKQQEKVQSEV